MRKEKTDQGKTAGTGKASPRLPHEHDESSDSSRPTEDKPSRGVIKQAHDDIVTGQKDTDLHGTPGLDKPKA